MTTAVRPPVDLGVWWARPRNRVFEAAGAELGLIDMTFPYERGAERVLRFAISALGPRTLVNPFGDSQRPGDAARHASFEMPRRARPLLNRDMPVWARDFKRRRGGAELPGSSMRDHDALFVLSSHVHWRHALAVRGLTAMDRDDGNSLTDHLRPRDAASWRRPAVLFPSLEA